MPQNYAVIRKMTATGTGKGTAIANASTTALLPNISDVSISGITGLIPKGTFIRFSNHTKVYMVAANATGLGATAVTLQIYPKLRVAVDAAATPPTTFTYKDDVLLNCVYDTDNIIGMLYSDGIMMDMGSVRLVEKL
jgi:hypothetical protein